MKKCSLSNDCQAEKFYILFSDYIIAKVILSCKVSLTQVTAEDIRHATAYKIRAVGMVLSEQGISGAISILNDFLVKMQTKFYLLQIFCSLF